MRFKAGLGAAATVAAMLIASSALAGDGGYGAGGFMGPGNTYGVPPAYGVGVYGPNNGPVGVGAFDPHRSRGFTGVFGSGFGGYGGYGGGDNFIVPGGNASVNNVIYYDARPRDGGFYGGGGVFYGDNGYSRVYSNRPAAYHGDGYCPPAADAYRPAQHVYYLSDYRRARRAPRY